MGRIYKTYGLEQLHFDALLIQQSGRCGVCNKPLNKSIFIDHEHVRGFKKMAPEMKRRFVRGLLCFTCNRYLVAKNTLATIDLVAAYLKKIIP